MKLSNDEAKALGFIALLVLLAAVARMLDRPPDLGLPASDAVDLVALERASMEALAADRRRRQPLGAGERIDPNTALAEELARLPGIGMATAQRMIASREADGAFATTGDLVRIRGIGAATVERLAPHLDLLSGPAARPVGPSPAPPAGVRAAAGRGRGAPADPSREPIDVNRATAPELERLPGIGPVIARRIVAHRDTAGPFRTPADLERVPGIGPATRRRLEPLVLVRP